MINFTQDNVLNMILCKNYSLKKFEQETERIGDQTSFSKKTSKTHTPKSMHDWCVMGINTIRDPIADIQEKRGISRHQ